MDKVYEIRTRELDKFITIKQVIDKKMTQREAALSLKISDRQIRRLILRIKTEGIEGIKSKHKGRNRLLSNDMKEKVMSLVRDKYYDFGPTFAVEKLTEEGFKVSKETLRKWMIEKGLWIGKRRKNIRLHASRERRPRFGELVQIDGSHHDWFEGRRKKCCLLVFIDDATSKIIGLRFEEAETTLGYMRLVKEHILNLGRAVAYYSDRHSIFKTTRSEMIDGRYEDTQFKRALRELNIELICAYSPEAKGRVERANQTLQDRLIKEMRLLGINTIETANKYLPEFIKKHNNKFAVKSENEEDAHRINTFNYEKIDQILSIQTERKLSKNLEFSYESKGYQITTPNVVNRLRFKSIKVCQTLNGDLNIYKDDLKLEFKHLPQKRKIYEAESKNINQVVDLILHQRENKQDFKQANFS